MATDAQIAQKIADLDSQLIDSANRQRERELELQTATGIVATQIQQEILDETTLQEELKKERHLLDPLVLDANAQLTDQALRQGVISVPLNRDPQKSSPKTTAKVKKPTSATSTIGDDRRSNLNPIGFDISEFASSIRQQIDAQRVLKASFSNDLSDSFVEPEINTLYRMMGFPVSGLRLFKGDELADDLTNEISDQRTSSINDLIDRGPPGTEDRYLFPVIDGAVPIPFAQRINFPFINTVLSIRLNKYDFSVDDGPAQQNQSDVLNQLEAIIIKNIDSLIENFPSSLLKKIQKIDFLDTVNSKKANLGNDSSTLDAQKPNFEEKDFSDLDLAKAEIHFSELNKNKKTLEQELLVENVLIALLPLDAIKNNQFSTSLIGFLTNNRKFLQDSIASLNEQSERLATNARQALHDLSAFDGSTPDTIQSFVDDKDASARDKLAGSITVPEILAVFSALFSLDERHLEVIAINNGISSSFDLIGILLADQSGTTPTDDEIIAQQQQLQTDTGLLIEALSALNTAIEQKVKKFDDVIKRSKPLIRSTQAIKDAYRVLKDTQTKVQKR